MEQILSVFDSSFKYILLGFNFITLIAVYFHKRSRKPKKEHHILIVTAHPDDEAMFFGPTINSLVGDYFVHLLCLSGGGTEREKELERAALYFGIHKFQCVSDPKLEDGMKTKWCEETILQRVTKYIEENNIRAIFTFDKHGVSGHVNHQAIHRSLSSLETTELPKENAPALKQEKTEVQANQQKEQPQVGQKVAENPPKQKKILKIYYLQSTNLLRKYTGLFQLLIALLKDFSWIRFNYFSAWRSMQCHKSQFLWYRKLFILFSRYSYINTYQLRRVCFQ